MHSRYNIVFLLSPIAGARLATRHADGCGGGRGCILLETLHRSEEVT